MLRRALIAVLSVCALAPAGAQAATDGTGQFRVTTNAYTFGQAPVWTPDGQVVFHDDFGHGDGEQIYRANLDGSRLRCLTCGQPGPNMVPVVRPQGDKVLFHSWRGRNMTIGAPGFGGLGSNVYVVNADGSNPVALTNDTEGEDNYHAYWSPDGKHLVWTHLNWNFVTDGGKGYWDVRVADYVDDAKGPHLTNVRVVRPGNGHFYETQWWKPDGSGFLYTESVGSAVNLELFFCRLTSSGCEVTRLTDNPAWDEQATFTPDGKHVIFMSTRDHPSIFNTYSTVAQAAGLPPDADYLLTLPIFEAGFLQPVGQASNDLYEIDLSTLAVRRLTTDGNDGWIIPEFAWDPSGTRLLWTELKHPDGMRVPLPVDPIKQLKQTAEFLSHPPTPNGTFGDRGAPGFYLDSRTRIGTFAGGRQ